MSVTGQQTGCKGIGTDHISPTLASLPSGCVESSSTFNEVSAHCTRSAGEPQLRTRLPTSGQFSCLHSRRACCKALKRLCKDQEASQNGSRMQNADAGKRHAGGDDKGGGRPNDSTALPAVASCTGGQVRTPGALFRDRSR